MDKVSPSKKSPSRGHPFLSGFMAGLVVGVVLCAGITIYVVRSPSPFQNRVLDQMGAVRDLPTLPKPTPKPANDEPVVSDGKAPEDSAAAPEKSLPSPLPGNLYLQVGAFATAEDAEKQIETIASITGFHAKLVTGGSDANKGLVRVRLGPFSQVADTSELAQVLKSNGIPYSLVRPGAGEVVH